PLGRSARAARPFARGRPPGLGSDAGALASGSGRPPASTAHGHPVAARSASDHAALPDRPQRSHPSSLEAATVVSEPFRIMSYNVRYFGHALRGLASMRATKRNIALNIARL